MDNIICRECSSDAEGGGCTECGRLLGDPECRECGSEIEGGCCTECGSDAAMG
jgi:hypothetical protein